MNTSARHILNVVVTYAIAVILAVSIASFVILCTGCTTTFYGKDGRPEAIFAGDMTRTEYTRSADGAVRWTADSVSHSVPTQAAGTAIQGNLGVVGTAVTAATAIPVIK